MLKSIDKIEFTAKCHLEGSWGSSDLGTRECSMELFDIDGCLQIEFIAGEDSEHIGLTFDNKVLVDYDGVFSLPSEAIKLLRDNGYTVPDEFEPMN